MTEQRANFPIEPTPEWEPRLALIRRPERDSQFWAGCRDLLRRAALRPTYQRMVLAWILFSGGNRHITADRLYEEAIRSKVSVSLATIYNTLHQFTEAGLLRQIGVDGSKSFFDTNPTVHHHFFVESEEALFDVSGNALVLDTLPPAPEGYEIVRVDAVVRLRRKQGRSSD